jgi:transposase-like protein
MARGTRTEIVELGGIYSVDLFKDIIINDKFFDEFFLTRETACTFLARSLLIKNSTTCDKCALNRPMHLVKRTKNIDGCIWNCSKPCNASKSIRIGSIFENSKLSFRKIIKAMYKYISRISYLDIAHDLEINRKTASAYGMLCRDRIIDEVITNSQMLGGRDEFGIPKIVEIDESLFFRAKYNRGNHTVGQWYVGGIERGSKKAFLVPVASRNTATLLQVIQDHVLPGSIVITDQWRAYDTALRQIAGIEHRTVNHSLHFVNPNDPDSHTQGIEGFWSISKKYVRSIQGLKQDEHYDYLLQFIWTYNIPKRQHLNYLLLLFRINP